MKRWTALTLGVVALLLATVALAAETPSRPSATPEDLIRMFDRDGDGRISREEAPERMRQRWDQIDTDHDGFITPEELKARDARVGATGSPAGQLAPGSSGGGRPQDAGLAARFQPGGKFTVITVGTGSPRYDPERSGPSAMIQYQRRYFLVDMGNGTQAKLHEAGITPRQIDALLLTHHHLDHNEEFIPLFMGTRLAGGKPEIVGPPRTKALVDFITDFYAEDIRYRLQRSGRTPEDFAPASIREIQGGESFDLGGLKVTTARVNHTIHTVAYRFDADGLSIVISGDLFYSESLVDLARGADVLVIDSGGAIVRKGEPAKGGGPLAGAAEGRGRADALKAHSSLQEIIAMAQKSGAKRLVLTHIAPGEVDEQATIRAIGEGYKGEVIVAHDLLEVSPATGQVPAAAGQAPAPTAGSARVHVSAAGSTAKPDGKSWATAFQAVQTGIDAAANQGGGEVWVAQGVYKPTSGSDRNISIQLRSGVALYGGFGGTERQRDERDWQRNPTVLSGDIGQQGVATDNSYHVVTGADGAVLDGFVITGGYGLDAGRPAGMGREGGGQARQGPPGQGPPIHITPETILAGASPGSGAGMLNFQCAPTVRNCTFKDNSAGKGGAMYNMASRSFPPRRDAAAPAPLVVDCRFVGNNAKGRGGAVANDLGTSPTFRGCAFVDNSCDAKGGAVYNDFGCSPTLVNCLFARNCALEAGAMGNDGGSAPLIVHCTFTRNVAEEEGAALYQGTGPANSPVVFGCILWDNRCEHGPAEIFNWHDNDPQVTGSCIQGGYPGQGNFESDPKFVDPDKGDYQLRPDSPCKNIGYTAAAPEDLVKRADTRPAPGMDSRPAPETKSPVAARTPAGTPPAILYVNAGNAQGPWDGTSWARAYRSLEEALAAASGRRAEVWVAAGTYKPATGADRVADSPGRAAAFQLHDGVEVYGGFRGRETQRSERDWQANATILSGDVGRAGDASDNAYHVVIGADGAVLDGFVVCDGNADGRTYDAKGAGMINYRRAAQVGPMGAATGVSPVVRNCTFTHNRAREGGAVYNYDRGAPEFIHCRFVENAADYGGAMVDRVGVRSVLTGCEFQGNTARWRGGAVYLDYGSRPRMTDCRFTGNRSECHGGALATISRASQLENTIAVLKNCTFAGNKATMRGGALSNFDNGILGLDACTFSDNLAGTGGGAMSNESRSRAVLVDCRFAGNRSERGQADVATDDTSSVSRDRSDWPDQTVRPKPMGFGPPRR